MAVSLGQPVAAFGELVAESLSPAGHPRQFDQPRSVPPAYGFGRVALIDDAAFVELHGTCDGHPHGHGVEPQLITDIVGLGDGRQVVHHTHGDHGETGFEFRPFSLSGKFGRLRHLGNPAAGNRTGPAGAGFLQIFFRQGLTAYGLPAVERAPLVVPGRQYAVLLGQGDHDAEGSVLAERRRMGLGGRPEFAHHPRLDLIEPLLVGNPDLCTAADDNRLEVFRSHHGAHPTPPGRTILVVHDAGKQDPLLSRRADAGDTGLGVGL